MVVSGIVEGGLDAPVTLAFILVVELPRIIPFGDSFTWNSLSRVDWRGLVSLETTEEGKTKSAGIHM